MLLFFNLKEYFEFEQGFKNEINKKIAELDTKVNTIASKTIKFPEKEKLIESDSLFYKETQDQLQVLGSSGGLLNGLLGAIPEVKAAAIVSTDGKIGRAHV